MGIIKTVVGMAMEIVINSNGEVVGIPEDEDLLNLLEETGGRGGWNSGRPLLPTATTRSISLMRP